MSASQKIEDGKHLGSRYMEATEVKPKAGRRGGGPANPGDGVLPILRQLEPGRLKVVGTGFYITRYGLVATAKHVIEDFAEGTQLLTAYIPHLAPDNKVHLRQLLKASLLKSADVAVAQADNFLRSYPMQPLANLRSVLSHVTPSNGERLATFAYPENAILDFSKGEPPEIRGDYYTGKFVRAVSTRENPYMALPYWESTVEVRGGASGAPVFDSSGRVVAVNCRGWDFRGAEHEGNILSYQVPVTHLLDLEIDPFLVPPESWEAQQIPTPHRNRLLTVRDLVDFGHIAWEPSLI